MFVIALLFGVAIPLLNGWLLLRVLEWKTPVLLSAERWIMGFLVGLTASMYLAFLANMIGVPLNAATFLLLQLFLFLILAGVSYRWLRPNLFAAANASLPSLDRPLTRWLYVIGVLLALWTALRIVAGGTMLLSLPQGFDDTFKNWNFRGKVIFLEHSVAAADKVVPSFNAYPPIIPLAKAWFTSLAGTWSEPLANLPHLLWYVSILGILFFTLRRIMTLPWAFLGVYLFVSLPLPFIHGFSAYAETLVAAHFLLTCVLLFAALGAKSSSESLSFLRLFALAAALLALPKNEGLSLYLPCILVIAAFFLMWTWRSRSFPRSTLRSAAAWIGGFILVTELPWMAYKWIHSLGFGNTTNLGSVSVHFNSIVPFAIAINLFFEGNWLLFFPLFILLLLLALLRRSMHLPLVALLCCFLLPFLAQFLLFTFTTFSTEAVISQTGYGRGIVQLIPVGCAAFVLLAHALFASRSTHES